MTKGKLDLGGWISVGANLAVLGGLILVAVQINQNTSVIRGAAYQTWVASNLDFNLAVAEGGLGEVLNRGHADPRALTQDEYIEYAVTVYSLMQMVQATDYLYQEGAIDESLRAVELQRAALHLQAPGPRGWWDAGGKTQLTPEFVDLVESTEVTIDWWGWNPEEGFVRGEPLGTPGN